MIAIKFTLFLLSKTQVSKSVLLFKALWLTNLRCQGNINLTKQKEKVNMLIMLERNHEGEKIAKKFDSLKDYNEYKKQSNKNSNTELSQFFAVPSNIDIFSLQIPSIRINKKLFGEWAVILIDPREKTTIGRATYWDFVDFSSACEFAIKLGNLSNQIHSLKDAILFYQEIYQFDVPFEYEGSE